MNIQHVRCYKESMNLKLNLKNHHQTHTTSLFFQKKIRQTIYTEM